jgi:hypothetical protein
MKAIKLLALAILGFLILVALAFLGQKDPSPEEVARRDRVTALRADEAKARDAAVKEAVKNGVVRKVTCQGNEAQVPRLTWLAADADTKRALTTLLATWCDDQQSGNRMTVIDAQSGQTLASYDGRTYSVR